ncbi:aldose 1-epimerase family protein [Thermomonospora umbrina]|uniref:Aldose 1-epimerase n=1 Tax=Thermomonospora umbrina TaxID=111806 RepID=A0A3D9SVK3_9ACTN|nr:aldose 1-epimerase family protein [Thermomonospora umbrina]REE99617.1 aldose 1-epimerase [Thermomonospora umbrina]
MTEPVTGEQFEIAAGEYRAVVTEGGAGLRELTFEDRPLILSHDADEPAPAALGQLLIPWPNRVDRGRYVFGGREHQLDLSEPENDCAIHGLVRWSPWTAAEREPHRVLLTHRLLAAAGYPYRLDLTAEFTLDARTGLAVRVTAVNTGTRTAPYAHGTHPYLTVGEPIDGCEVTVAADRYLPVDDRKIPSGPPQDVTGTPYDRREPALLGDLRIDNAYTGLHRDAAGRAWGRLRGGGRAVSFWLDDAHPWLEVYTADDLPPALRRRGLGMEPMTCPPNGLTTGIDVIELGPGDTTTGSWGIIAE